MTAFSLLVTDVARSIYSFVASEDSRNEQNTEIQRENPASARTSNESSGEQEGARFQRIGDEIDGGSSILAHHSQGTIQIAIDTFTTFGSYLRSSWGGEQNSQIQTDGQSGTLNRAEATLSGARIRAFGDEVNHTVISSARLGALGYQDSLPQDNQDLFIQVVTATLSRLGSYLRNSFRTEQNHQRQTDPIGSVLRNAGDSLDFMSDTLQRMKSQAGFVIGIQEVEQHPNDTLLQLSSHIKEGAFPTIVYKDSGGLDWGGLTRDFISRLFDGLHHAAPNKQLSENLLLPYCDKNNSDVSFEDQLLAHRTIGKIFGAAFSGYQEIVTGNHFNPIIFEMIHSLTEEELSQIPENLNEKIPQQIVDKLFSIYVNDMKKTNANITDEQVEKILQDRFQDALAEGVTLEDIYGTANKDELMEEPFMHILYGTLAIAQGMHTSLQEQQWEEIRNGSFEDLQNRIEGSLSLDQILGALEWNQENSTTQKYLEKWLNEASEKEQEEFVYTLSGSKTLSSGTKFTIYLYNEKHRLPTYHTCTKNMELPNNYENYQVFKEKLEMSLTSGKDGFQFL